MRVLMVILSMLVLTHTSWAQSQADRLFDRGDYLEALKLYQKELESNRGGSSEENHLLKIKVANCFFHLNDVVRAGQLYKTVNPDLLGAEDLTYYAISLLHTGDYEKAAEQIELAEALGADPVLVERVKGSCGFAEEMAKEKPLYTANKTKINFAGFSAGVTYYKGKSVILAAPGTGEDAMKDSRGYKVTRLYNAVFTGDGTSGRLMPFANELTDRYHIGAVTFTQDFKRIYYTRTILKKDGSSILKLMTAVEEEGKWGQIEELNINSDDYSCAHPCLYRDSLLFFVSDMPGGLGGKDIYMTEIQGAECGEIQNLGEQINTDGDEVFPFVAADGKLFFASNGHIGLGGLDVFVSQSETDGSWSFPVNMGRPVNSSMDDFALVFRDVNCMDGYVSSNRGGTGYNDFLFALRKLPERKTPSRMPSRPAAKSLAKEQPDVLDEELFTVDYQYAIQVGAFRNPVPRVYFERFKNVKVYLGADNIYRYTVGEYPEEHFAGRDLQQVRRDVGDAFVMNVERYVKEKKIQHDVRGDDISDDELLLRRLKNFEKSGRLLEKKSSLPAPRVLEKPKNSEIQTTERGYTVVLMSVDQVYDPSKFQGIENVDVFAIRHGKYMYCAGLFNTREEAEAELKKVQAKGFKEAYILQRKGSEFYSATPAPTASTPPARSTSMTSEMRRQNGDDLKRILNF